MYNQNQVFSPESSPILKTPQKRSSLVLKQKNYTLIEGVYAHGKNSEIYFVSRSPQTKFAVKKQKIHSPKNPSDKAYIEYLILKNLNKIKTSKHYFGSPNDFGFIGYVDWFKGKESHQFLHVVLEHADMSLMDYRTLTLYEYKCLLFQILFALFVAQTEYKFVHNDLHLKNILLKRPPTNSALHVFKHGENTWYTWGLVVKIADFGLSRLELPSGHILSNASVDGFDSHKDIEKVMNEFERYIRIDPESWLTPKEKEEATLNPEKLRLFLDQKQTLLRKLKAFLRKPLPISYYLGHPFFEELKQPPHFAQSDLQDWDHSIEHIDLHMHRLTLNSSFSSDAKSKTNTNQSASPTTQIDAFKVKRRDRSMAFLKATQLDHAEQKSSVTAKKQPKKRRLSANVEKENRSQNKSSNTASLIQVRRTHKTTYSPLRGPNIKKRRI
jgi:hypothetical protein